MRGSAAMALACMRSALRSATAPSAARSRAAIAARASCQIAAHRFQPRSVVGRRLRGPGHGLGRADQLWSLGRHGDDQAHVPAVALGEGHGVSVGAVAADPRAHLDEAAEDRTRRRAGAAPRQRGQLLGTQRQAGGARRRQRQRREPRRRRRQARGGRHGVLADHLGADLRPFSSRTRSSIAVTRSRALPVSSTPFRRTRSAGPRCGPKRTVVRVPSSFKVSDRLPAAGRLSERVALAPVLHERDVRSGDGGAPRKCHERSPWVGSGWAARGSVSPMVVAKAFEAGRRPGASGSPRRRRRVARGRSAMTAPPPPAPVSLAPMAPAARAADQRFQLGDDTPSAASSPWATSIRRPSPSTSPCRAGRPLAGGRRSPSNSQHARRDRRLPLAQPRPPQPPGRRVSRDRPGQPHAQRDRVSQAQRRPAGRRD